MSDRFMEAALASESWLRERVIAIHECTPLPIEEAYYLACAGYTAESKEVARYCQLRQEHVDVFDALRFIAPPIGSLDFEAIGKALTLAAQEADDGNE